MAIHPQTIRQLIQLDLLRNLDVLTSGSGVGQTDSDPGIDFNELLLQVMGGAEQNGFGSTDGAATGLADPAIVLKPLAGYSRHLDAIAAASSDVEGAWLLGDRAASGVNDADLSPSGGYDELIAGASARYGVDAALIKSVIATESGFRADAVSSAGAKGLMQLMDGTAQGLGVADAFDPGQNIDGGTRYLSYLLRRFDGSEQVALAAYNAGPGRVAGLGIASDADLRQKLDQLPEQTQRYIAKVLDAKRTYSAY